MKHILVTALVTALTALSQVAVAGIVPKSDREAIEKAVLDGFWGRAKTPDGKPIHPTSNEERQTLPVNAHVANFAFDVGELSGLAQWCGLDWNRGFTALMRQARSNNQTEKQVAFIAVVHGAAQGLVSSSMAKSGACNTQDRERARAQIESLLAREPK